MIYKLRGLPDFSPYTALGHDCGILKKKGYTNENHVGYGNHQFNFLSAFNSLISDVRTDIEFEKLVKIANERFLHKDMFHKFLHIKKDFDKRVYVGIDLRKGHIARAYLYNSQKESMITVSFDHIGSRYDRDFESFYKREFVLLYDMALQQFYSELNAENFLLYTLNNKELREEYYSILEKADVCGRKGRNPLFYNMYNIGCFLSLSKPDVKMYKPFCYMDYIMGELLPFFSNKVRYTYWEENGRNRDTQYYPYYSMMSNTILHTFYCFCYLAAKYYLEEKDKLDDIELYNKMVIGQL